jgi:hypothetical protein
MVPCDRCGDPEGFICRVRRSRADYFCSVCMNIERDLPNGVMKGDTWLAVASA